MIKNKERERERERENFDDNNQGEMKNFFRPTCYLHVNISENNFQQGKRVAKMMMKMMMRNRSCLTLSFSFSFSYSLKTSHP